MPQRLGDRTDDPVEPPLREPGQVRAHIVEELALLVVRAHRRSAFKTDHKLPAEQLEATWLNRD